jgi:hypothetical protein
VNSAQRKEIVAKLVCEGHISVPERHALVNGAAPRSLIAEIIHDAVQTVGCFPAGIPPEAPYDGHSIIVRAGRVTLTRRAEISYGQYATISTMDFVTLEQAIDVFIDSEWPNGIDGVPIDKT